MASGIEMMLKALGIDPEEIKRAMFDSIGRLQSGINEIAAHGKSVNERLERLEKHLGVQPATEENFGCDADNRARPGYGEPPRIASK